MKLFRNILVYAETADLDSLERVLELARRNDATVSVCDVVKPAPGLPDPNGTIARLKTLRWQMAFERLHSLCASHLAHGGLDYTVLTGNPFLAVAEQVIQQRFDLVVHISDPEVDGQHPILNPVGMHLVRKCPCAVWTMHPGRESDASGIVLAVDRDVVKANPKAESLRQKLASTAEILAAAWGERLHIVHAWEPFAEELLQHPRVRLAADEVETYADAQREDHLIWLEDFAETLRRNTSGVEVQTHLVRGAATQVVPEVAQETGAGLIVMGTIGTSVVPGVLIGTNAEAILSSTPTSVLALKPQGFASPLRFRSKPQPTDSKLEQGAIET
jgi:nucleotide-binding universal stress UspA family protein